MFWNFWRRPNKPILERKPRESYLEFSIRLNRDGLSPKMIDVLWTRHTGKPIPASSGPTSHGASLDEFDKIIDSFIAKENNRKEPTKPAEKPVLYAYRFYTDGMIDSD